MLPDSLPISRVDPLAEASDQSLRSRRLAALANRLETLPEGVAADNQVLGLWNTGCGATHGIHEACNFGCTACYLGGKANKQKPMPFEQVAEQLEQLSAFLGPGGNVQLTSGEVTLLPVEDLVRIILYARELDLSPMVMTHGDVWLHDPEYLQRLVEEGGLRKLSIHVDMTQRGRKGMSLPKSEAALNAVRDQMATMVKACRKRTGVDLKAATTMTVNRENLDQLGEVVTWFAANLDAFRMISFQPQAQTGRTRDQGGVSADDVWSRVEAALGAKLNPHPILLGDADCNRIGMAVMLEDGARRSVIDGIREGNREDQALITRLLRDFRGVVLNNRGLRQTLPQILPVVLRKPWWIPRATAYVLKRCYQERHHLRAFLKSFCLGRLRVRPFVVVVHAFMDRDQLQTPSGKRRLAACAFRVAHQGRMVSMCEFNGADMRVESYEV